MPNMAEQAKSQEERELEDVLYEWELGEYFDNFKKAKLMVKHFPSMSPQDLEDVIPFPGHRIEFKHCLKRRIQAEKEDHATASENIEEQSEESIPKKRKAEDDMVFDQDMVLEVIPPVEEILSKTSLGKCIIDCYKEKGILTRRQQNEIVDIIIKDIHARTTKINNFILKKIGLRIQKLFPSESLDTYYIDNIPKKNSPRDKSEASRGKLPHKWANFKKHCKIPITVNNETNNEAILEEDVEESIKWLKLNAQAFVEEAQEHWKKTCAYRRKEILDCKDSPVIETTILKYDILKKPECHELISLDFKQLFPTCAEINMETWKKFYNDVSSIVLPMLVHRDANRDRLKSILNQENLSEDARLKVQLEVLCHLLPPKSKKVKKIDGKLQTWKISQVDCFKSIIQHAKMPADMQLIKDERLAVCQKWGLTLQPFIIIIGASELELTSFFVYVSEKVVYKASSLIEALIICYRCIFVFNVDYPLESAHIWTLIQKILFKQETEKDWKYGEVESVLKKLQNGINNNDHVQN